VDGDLFGGEEVTDRGPAGVYVRLAKGTGVAGKGADKGRALVDDLAGGCDVGGD